MNTCEMPYTNNEVTSYSPLYEVLNIYPEKRVDTYESRVTG